MDEHIGWANFSITSKPNCTRLIFVAYYPKLKIVYVGKL